MSTSPFYDYLSNQNNANYKGSCFKYRHYQDDERFDEFAHCAHRSIESPENYQLFANSQRQLSLQAYVSRHHVFPSVEKFDTESLFAFPTNDFSKSLESSVSIKAIPDICRPEVGLPATREFRQTVSKVKKKLKLQRATVPEEMKDESYWSKRKKNNDSARRSREARRLKEERLLIDVDHLEQENQQLRAEVLLLRKEISQLRHSLYVAA